jgi:tellurite resistance protein TerC
MNTFPWWGWVAFGAGLLFNVFVWIAFGGQAAQEYLAAYLIEKSLSLDFQTLQIPEENQRRVLFWGIFGAMAFRGIFIFLGVRALARWDWLSYIFGTLLLYAGFKAWRKDPSQQEESKLVAWLQRHLPVTDEQRGGQFIFTGRGRSRSVGGRCASRCWPC